MNRKSARVLYVGDKSSIHHQRFIRLLESNFQTRTVFTETSRTRDFHSFAPDLVICGPLQEPLRYALEMKVAPILGISWAEEFNEPRGLYQDNSEFSKVLQQLCGLVVDNHHHAKLIRNTLNIEFPIKVIPFNLEPLPVRPLKRLSRGTMPIIISARNFEPVYRNDLILKSISSLTDEINFLLLMVGGGSQLESIKKMHTQMHLEHTTRFLGPITNTKLLKLMSTSHFYVSAASSDGISVTLLEAMQLGLVCLVSDFPTNTEVIQHGSNGFLFSNGDPISLASALRFMLNLTQDRLDSISMNAQSTVREKFSWRKSSSNFLSFVESFLV